MDNKFYRFEFKYLLTPEQGRSVREALRRHGLKPDKHATEADGSYYVTSVYFDSFDLFDYQDKAGGFMERKKLRARIYEPCLNTSTHVLLEVKHKHEGQNAKTKILLRRDQWGIFAERGPSALLAMDFKGAEEEKREIVRNFIHFSAKPVLKIRYLRKAFMDASKDLRINFDQNIEACRNASLMYNSFAVPVNKGTEVMEVKYSYVLPFWLNAIFKKHNLERTAFSKYAYSMEATHRHNPISR